MLSRYQSPCSEVYRHVLLLIAIRLLPFRVAALAGTYRTKASRIEPKMLPKLFLALQPYTCPCHDTTLLSFLISFDASGVEISGTSRYPAQRTFRSPTGDTQIRQTSGIHTVELKRLSVELCVLDKVSAGLSKVFISVPVECHITPRTRCCGVGLYPSPFFCFHFGKNMMEGYISLCIRLNLYSRLAPL